MSDRNRVVLELAAAQKFVIKEQAAELLSGQKGDRSELLAAADEELMALVSRGLLKRDRLVVVGDRFRITAAGLRAIGSSASPPEFDPRRHGFGVGGLWLMARAGELGRAPRFLSERQMRLEDRESGAEAPFAVQPHWFGGRPEAHYPDLMLLGEEGRAAIEFVFAVPGARQLEAVMRAYAADARTAVVLYLVTDPRVRPLLERVAAALELSDMTHVWVITFEGRIAA